MGLYRAVASEYILCPHDRKKIQEKRQTEKNTLGAEMVHCTKY